MDTGSNKELMKRISDLEIEVKMLNKKIDEFMTSGNLFQTKEKSLLARAMEDAYGDDDGFLTHG